MSIVGDYFYITSREINTSRRDQKKTWERFIKLDWIFWKLSVDRQKWSWFVEHQASIDRLVTLSGEIEGVVPGQVSALQLFIRTGQISLMIGKTWVRLGGVDHADALDSILGTFYTVKVHHHDHRPLSMTSNSNSYRCAHNNISVQIDMERMPWPRDMSAFFSLPVLLFNNNILGHLFKPLALYLDKNTSRNIQPTLNII